MKTDCFNLIDEAWVPVLTIDGSYRRVSLKELFDEGERIADLSLNPYERVAVMRLLIGIAMAALPEADLADEAAWRQAYSKLRPSASNYFKQWHDRFNLFGPHAFMQPDDVKAVDESKMSTIKKLFPDCASGNNGTLFDHGRELSRWQLPIGMLVYQHFSAGGRHSICLWGHDKTSPSVSAGPSREKSMLHVFLHGANILETIHCNLLTMAMIEQLPSQPSLGRPVWEMPDLSRGTLVKAGVSETVFGWLVPLSRVMKFSPDSGKIPLGEGLKYKNLSDGIRNPYASVIRNKEDELVYVATSQTERPWRNLQAILARRESYGALILRRLNDPQFETFAIWCGGLVANQAKDEASDEWLFSGNRQLLVDTSLEAYSQGIECAKTMAGRAASASDKYCAEMKIDKKTNPFKLKVVSLFWDRLEKHQRLLIEITEPEKSEKSMKDWEREVLTVAREAFEQTCPNQTGRQLEAFVKSSCLIALPKEEHKEKKVVNER